MSIFRRNYESLRIILDPTSSLDVALVLLKKFIFIFLAVNALVGFVLITAITSVSQDPRAFSSRPVLAFGITYIILFSIILTAVSIMYARIAYFKNHPLRSPPTGYLRPSTDADEGGNMPRKSINFDESKVDQEASVYHNLRFESPQRKHDRAKRPGSRVEYHSLSNVQNSFHGVDDADPERSSYHERTISNMDGISSEVPRHSRFGHYQAGSDTLPTDITESNEGRSWDRLVTKLDRESGTIRAMKDARRSIENSRGDPRRHGSIKGVVEDARRSRAQPFSPSMAQLTGWEDGTPNRYKTYEEAAAALRSNWNKGTR